ncbi:sigma factor-like helix-turn-helix DNA-binding protein [Marisediminicola antarctica]
MGPHVAVTPGPHQAAIAIALNIPVGTVRSRLNRARRKLRIAIDPGAARDEEVEHERGLAPASD